MAKNRFDIFIKMGGATQILRDLNLTEKGMNRLRGATANLRRSVGALRNNMLLFSFTVGSVLAGTRALIEQYRKQLEAQQLLTQGLSNISGVADGASERLQALASSLQKVTTFGDESIIMAQAQLATFQLSEETIAALSERMLDLAVGSQTDLISSAKMLGKAFTGQATALSRAGVLIDRVGLAQARANGPVSEANFLISELDKNYAGLARSLAETELGQFDQLENEIGDLNEEIGRLMIPLNKFTTGLQKDMVFGFNVMLKTFQGLPEKSLRDAFGSALQQTNAMLNGVKANLDDLEKKAQTVFTLEQQIKDLKTMLPLYKLIGVEQANNLSVGAMLSEEQIESIAKLDPMLRKQMALDAEISTQKKINALEQKSLGEVSQASLVKLSELEVKRLETNIALNEATTNSFANMLNAFAELAGVNKRNAILAAKLSKASAIINTFQGATKALGDGGVKGIFQAAAVIATGMANVVKIDAQLQAMKSAATGANFVTTGPQLMLVGDNPGGQERVQVTPLSSPSGPNSPDGSGITINVSAPLVDETVIDAIIPAIEKAQKMNLA
tara:strand:- start:3041 stop:4723 length:1683 start_codon:yes stop_codon:yes gene_type:complete